MCTSCDGTGLILAVENKVVVMTNCEMCHGLGQAHE